MLERRLNKKLQIEKSVPVQIRSRFTYRHSLTYLSFIFFYSSKKIYNFLYYRKERKKEKALLLLTLTYNPSKKIFFFKWGLNCKGVALETKWCTSIKYLWGSCFCCYQAGATASCRLHRNREGGLLLFLFAIS